VIHDVALGGHPAPSPSRLPPERNTHTVTTDTDNATLSDREQVTDTVNRMACCEERKRWTDLEDVLDDEIQVGYGEHPDEEPVTVSRAELIANWRSRLEHTSSQHILTGMRVDPAGDAAHATLNETRLDPGKDGRGIVAVPVRHRDGMRAAADARRLANHAPHTRDRHRLAAARATSSELVTALEPGHAGTLPVAASAATR